MEPRRSVEGVRVRQGASHDVVERLAGSRRECMGISDRAGLHHPYSECLSFVLGEGEEAGLDRGDSAGQFRGICVFEQLGEFGRAFLGEDPGIENAR